MESRALSCGRPTNAAAGRHSLSQSADEGEGGLFVEEDARSSQLQMSATPSCDKTCTVDPSLPLNTRPFPTSLQTSGADSIGAGSPDRLLQFVP
jgi:hypothetical protein